jgi:hypothetical protein
MAHGISDEEWDRYDEWRAGRIDRLAARQEKQAEQEQAEGRVCEDCVAWCRVSGGDGGIGICDCRLSDHDQHLVGLAHRACAFFLTVDAEVA